MKPKKILLLSHNFSPEPIGIGKYNGEMLNWLCNRGYECTVVTTYPYYPQWKVQAPYTNRWFKKEVVNYDDAKTTLTIYRCPSYIPSNPTGSMRAIQDFSYLISKFFVIFKLILFRKRFDLIITIAPPFHLAYLGMLLKLFNGGKLLYHVQDLQIEAARELKMFSSKNILKALFKIERHILRKADFVSSISDGMIEKIKAKVNRDVFYFPNWADTTFYKPLPGRNLLKRNWGFIETDFVCLYSGAAGVKQGLTAILVAAEQLMDDKNIKFVICTSGPYKDLLMQAASAKELTNVTFLPVQDKESFNEFLNMADLHLVMQKATAGDLVMPSKLATILAVGGASLTTTPAGTSLYKMITNHDLGYIVEPGNDELFVKRLQEIIADKDIDTKRANARNYAALRLNIDSVMHEFVKNAIGVIGMVAAVASI